MPVAPGSLGRKNPRNPVGCTAPASGARELLFPSGLQKSPSPEMSLPNHGRAQQASRGCHDDVHWHIRQQRAHRGLVAEGIQEARPVQRRQDAGRDAAADEQLRPRRARGAPGCRPRCRRPTRRATAPRGIARSGSRALPRVTVAGRSSPSSAASQASSRCVSWCRCDQPRAAQHVLDRGAAVLLAQHAHQLVLAPVARGKVRVSALRWHRQEAGPPTRTRRAWPRPVPAAITAITPSGRALPGCSVTRSSASSASSAYASASTSFSS